jgi:hypothetical protein
VKKFIVTNFADVPGPFRDKLAAKGNGVG